MWKCLTSYRLMARAGSLEGGDGGEPADDELVRQCQKGDRAAFDLLMTRHRGKVYAMVLKMVKNEADAWDLSQDVFIKVWKALPKFQHKSAFSTWLFRITHNVVYDWARRRKARPEDEWDDEVFDKEKVAHGATTLPKAPSRPDRALQNAELRVRIERAIAQLSLGHREVILLREVQGLDYREIAEVCECSMGTVMSRLFYARKKLQELLKDER